MHCILRFFACLNCVEPAYDIYRVFTRSSKHRANIELAQAGLLEPRPWLKCRPRLRLLAHG